MDSLSARCVKNVPEKTGTSFLLVMGLLRKWYMLLIDPYGAERQAYLTSQCLFYLLLQIIKERGGKELGNADV